MSSLCKLVCRVTKNCTGNEKKLVMIRTEINRPKTLPFWQLSKEFFLHNCLQLYSHKGSTKHKCFLFWTKKCCLPPLIWHNVRLLHSCMYSERKHLVKIIEGSVPSIPMPIYVGASITRAICALLHKHGIWYFQALKPKLV